MRSIKDRVKNLPPWEKIFGDGWVEMTIASVLIFIFASLAEDVWFKEPFAWDAPTMLAIHRLARPFIDKLMLLVTQMGVIGAGVAVFMLAIYFIAKHQRTNLISLIVIFGGAVVLNTLMKSLFARPRPDIFPPLAIEQSFSFPSGHVAASTAVYGFLAILLWQSHHRFWAIVIGLWIPIVAFSRMYLGVHYPSDVLGAFAFTSLWLLIIFVIRDRHLEKSRKPVNQADKPSE
jgi:membrane-associated phospholipid phosphatase